MPVLEFVQRPAGGGCPRQKARFAGATRNRTQRLRLAAYQHVWRFLRKKEFDWKWAIRVRRLASATFAKHDEDLTLGWLVPQRQS